MSGVLLDRWALIVLGALGIAVLGGSVGGFWLMLQGELTLLRAFGVLVSGVLFIVGGAMMGLVAVLAWDQRK